MGALVSLPSIPGRPAATSPERPAPEHLPPLPVLDPVARWAALSAQQQAEIGAVALALGLASAGADSSRPHEVAYSETILLLEELVGDALLAGDVDPLPRPDLRPLGIRACIGCGCTDDHACHAGCWWVTPDNCSNCAPPDNFATSDASASGER